ncbi:MAG: T9SS type A sorting domain-containing protein [Bacteroidales bacterium]|nr:T9SS type A sorting domain-containing protein [Bacteroidales bacterium]
MNIKTTIKLLLVAALLTPAIAKAQTSDTIVNDCALAVSMPWLETFDNGLLCWHVPDGSNWVIIGGYSSINKVMHSPCSSDGTHRWVMSKAVTLPADTALLPTLYWKAAGRIGQASYRYSVLVSTAADRTDTTAYTLLYFDTTTLPLTNYYNNNLGNRSTSLVAYAGQTIYVAFRNETSEISSRSLVIDDVEVRSAAVPRVSLAANRTTAYYGDTVTYTATLEEGNPNGLIYTWHSTLLDSTWVTYGSTSQCSLTYGIHNGIDHVSVVAANAYGSDTATVNVTSIIITEPLVSDFTAEGFDLIMNEDRAEVGDTVVYSITRNDCLTFGLTYSLHSTLLDTTVTMATTDTTCSITLVYNTAGRDTVTATISNIFSQSVGTIWMTVNNCPTVGVPYYNTFNDSTSCDCWPSAWIALDSRAHPQGTLRGWGVTPAINIPSDTIGVQLKWRASFNTIANIPIRILVSPTGSKDYATFTDTIKNSTTPNNTLDSVYLDAYLGQSIRVAFLVAGYLYLLDDVSVDYDRTPPQVSIHAPSTVYTHDSLPFYATLTAGVAQGLTCTWHSTLGTVFGSGDNIRIYYSSTGTDTLSVIATTAYGTDTATVMFPVVAHEMPQITLSAPAVVLMPDSATFTVTRNNCSSDGLNIVWHSSLMGTTVSTTNYQFTINYTAGGIDTVTVILSNLYGADTAVAIVTVHDCIGYSVIPFYEDFEGVAPTAYNAAGNLPSCWDFYWNGSNAAYAPHVITTSGYPYISNIPNHALFLVAGSATGYGNRAEVVLPRFSASLQTLSIAFDYRYESSQYGTLTVGYYDTTGVYTIVKTLPRRTGSYRRDTISFESANVPDAQIVLRWTHNSAYFAVVIDNIVVFHDSDIPAPDSLTVDNIEATQAHVSWNAVNNATAYHVLIAGVVNTTVNGPYCIVTGLTPSTTYTVRVAAIIGTEPGQYASTIFTTACGDQPLPYSENFESVAPWDGIVPGQLPDCWTKQWAGDAVQAPCVTNASATYSWVTGKSLRFYAGNLTSLDTIAYVILPSFVHNIDVLKLALDYTYAYDYSQGTLTVGYMTNSTFTPVHNLPRDTVDTEMLRDTVSFSGVSVTNAKIAIRYLNPGMTNDAYIDNIDVIVDSTLLPPDTIWRTVTVLCDSTMGTVSGGGTYPDSSLVTISATANEGYHFTQWDDGDTNAVRSILLTSDTSFTAFFEADTVWYNVNVVRELNGMIDTVPDGYITGVGRYPEGDTVTLTILNSDYKCWPTFYGWVLAPGDTVFGDVCQFVITCDTVITAYYIEVVGIEEVENGKLKVEIYPNPTHGDVTIAVTNALTHSHINAFTVTVVDLMGRTVMPPTATNSSLLIPHSTLPSGTYFVRITTDSGTAVRKLIVE